MEMKRMAVFVLLGVLLALAGCGGSSRTGQVISGIRGLDLAPSSQITLRQGGSHSISGTGMRLAHLNINGELVASGAAALPSDTAIQVAKKIGDHCRQHGCSTRSIATHQGPRNTDAVTSFEYSLGRCQGRVDVWVIETAYESEKGKVLGQIIVTVNEAR